ncbi:MAG: simple sugar transport system ATP-binding protein [Chloroflexi bacterium]|nr:simple sugar transport system ATP-binding protein [Chloroflexota bacterium]
MAINAVELQGITKVFGPLVANDAVDMVVRHGEIHALVGENGAGKTTLMNVLFGLYRPDAGRILLDGVPTELSSPQVAIKHGVGMVHQHFMLLPSLTVAENIVLGVEPAHRAFGIGLLLNRKRARELTRELSTKYGLRVEPDAVVQDLSVGLRQRVEILKTLARGVKILILDEPTAVLTPQETDELFIILRTLVAGGMTIIFISHKLREVMDVSQTISVMRLGRMVGTVLTSQTSPPELARMMIGRDALPTIARTPATPGKPVLVVSGLRADDDRGVPALRGLSLQVHAGEILGIAGVEGNGQSELVEVLTGLRQAESGHLELNGRDITRLSTKGRREAGMSAIPEDRLKDGVAAAASIRDNLAMSQFYRRPLTRRGILSPRRMSEYARRIVSQSDIRTKNIELPASSLSGGNMQKLVVARELGLMPKLLIAAQPTRGVDIGAIEAIHKRIIGERDRGAAVLVISAELSEVLALSDRIAVMYEGEVTGVFDAGTVTEEELGLFMLGVKRQAGTAA